MANKRQTMRRIREILRLKLDCGLSNRDTARSAGSSPASVSDMLKRAREAGLTTWAEVEALDEERLEAMLYKRPYANPGELIGAILQTRRHPEQGYRACLGTLRLAKRHGKARLEAACARALLTNIRRVRQIEAILESGADRLGSTGVAEPPDAPVIEHDNVRGPGYSH